MGFLSDIKNRILSNFTGLEFGEYGSYFLRKPLSDYLLAAAYDEELGCYLCRDNSIAFAFECFPKPMVGEETISTLKDIFSSNFLPPKTNIQITLWADDNLLPFTERFKNLRQNADGSYWNEWSKIWCESFTNYLLNHTRKGPHDVTPTPFRNFKLFVSFKMPYDVETYMQKSQDLGIAIKNVATSLETAYLFPQTITPEKYLYIMNLILNPNHKRQLKTAYDPNIFIYEQVIDADTETEIGKSALHYDGIYGKALTTKQFPESFSIVDTMTFSGDLLRNELQLNCPFLITLNLTIQEESIKDKTQQKAEFLYKQKAASALSVKLTKKQEEAQWMIEKIVDGNRLMKGYIMWYIYHDDLGVVSKTAQVLKSMLNMKGFKLQEEVRSMNMGLLMSCLPANINYEIDEKLIRRQRTMFDFNAAHLSPVQSDWKGTGTPAVPFLSRRGQLIYMDLFDGSEGYNAIVAAKTGSGKSFFTQHVISSYYSIPKVSNIWVIDIGESYKALCKNQGGQYLDFNEEANIIINPFSECEDLNEDMDLLISLVAKMAKPTEKLTDTDKSVIEEAIKNSFQKYKKDTNVDTLIEALRKIEKGEGASRMQEDRVKRDSASVLATNLFRWSSGGVFGKFFNGKNNIDLKHKFIVLELKNLSHREDLRNVMLMVLFYHIYRVVYMDDDRSKRKLLIFDEAWQFFDDPQIAKFIERAYRTFRKHGSSAMTITQGIHDFYKNESTRELLFQSAYWFLLSQKQESINMLREEKRVSLNDYEFELMSSLKTIRQVYSEIFFVTPFGRGVGRLRVPREHYWLYTTDAADVAKRDEMVARFGLEEGIRKCAETYV